MLLRKKSQYSAAGAYLAREVRDYALKQVATMATIFKTGFTVLVMEYRNSVGHLAG